MKLKEEARAQGGSRASEKNIYTCMYICYCGSLNM
jgi:hypothetical protein